MGSDLTLEKEKIQAEKKRFTWKSASQGGFRFWFIKTYDEGNDITSIPTLKY